MKKVFEERMLKFLHIFKFDENTYVHRSKESKEPNCQEM